MRFAGVAVAAFAFAAASACIVLVNPDELGTHCRFAGADTACGQCLASSCRGEIDACCGAAGCAADLDTCASNSCAAAAADDRAWAVYARDRCATACGLGPVGGDDASTPDGGDAGGDSGPPKPTKTSCTNIGEGCTCKLDAPPNGKACGEETIPNGRCCASNTWPSSGTCTCDPITCEINSFGCECGLIDNGPLATCTQTTTRPTCCARSGGFGTCICSNKLCTSADGDEVASCTGPTTPCQGNKRKVTSCAF